MKITKDKWIWMPHPAHFICASDCKFFLSTKVGNYIISTVGELWQDRQVREIHAQVHNPEWLKENRHLKGDNFDNAYMEKFGFAEIGLDRKYETMVFKAKKSNIKCCPFVIVSSQDLDMDSYNKPEEAYRGHYKLCNKWANKK